MIYNKIIQYRAYVLSEKYGFDSLMAWYEAEREYKLDSIRLLDIYSRMGKEELTKQRNEIEFKLSHGGNRNEERIA